MKTIKCDLCGFEFNKEKGYNNVCIYCIFGKNKEECGFVRCPKCGYEILLKKPGISNFIESMLKIRDKLWQKKN
jgi:DNA-directed RNA polymerase subunit RPC12/RpoP